jgi:molybdate transport system substrate-binding protein
MKTSGAGAVGVARPSGRHRESWSAMCPTASRLASLWSCVAALAVVSLLGCQEARNSAPKRRLSIAAASDLQTVLPVLIRRFRSATPSIEVEATYGASGQFANQIAQGAPFDLFLSADLKFVQRLVAANAVESRSVRPYAIGSLVLAANRVGGAKISSLDDLKRPEVKKVAIANPETAPYGAAAKQALMHAGLWEDLQAKLVIAGTVRQSLQFVQTGNAEAALVGRASADVPEVKVVEIDQASYEPITQGLGIVITSANKNAAEQFIRYLLGTEGQATLASFGFRPPRPVDSDTEK